MKKATKLLAVLLAVFTLLSSTVLAADIPSKSTVKKAYAAYVEKNLSDEEEYPYSEYTLFDINNDGIKEMLFTYMCGVRAGYKIYTYSNGKVKHMKSIEGGCGVTWSKSKKRICVTTSSGAAYTTYTVYTMKNTSLKKGVQYKEKGSKYYKNDKKISEKSFNKAVKKYWGWKNVG